MPGKIAWLCILIEQRRMRRWDSAENVQGEAARGRITQSAPEKQSQGEKHVAEKMREQLDILELTT
eukprot:1162028-Pelagomonas_calceolata.AAC.10